MPRMSRRDRKIRAAFKRRIQLNVPEIPPLPEWDFEGELIDDDAEREAEQYEHA